jgi:hypothetical protein
MLLLNPLSPPEQQESIERGEVCTVSIMGRALSGCTVNRVPAVVLVHVVDFAVEDEPAAGNSLCYAARYRPEVLSIVLVGQSKLQK